MMKKNQMNTGIFWVDMNSYFERDNEGYNEGDNQRDNQGDNRKSLIYKGSEPRITEGKRNK